MIGRTAPPRTADQQKHAERIQALLSGDVAQIRAWAERHGVTLLGDDRTVEISYHETRATEQALPVRVRRESREWLQEHYAESVVLRRRHE